MVGMLVKLKEVAKRKSPVWSTIARPIIISAGEPIEISPNQINFEVNEANATLRQAHSSELYLA